MDAPAGATAPGLPAGSPLWKRPLARRTILAAGATGAAGLALAALWRSGDLTRAIEHVQDLTHGYQGPFTSERVKVAHLLRRAGFGATPSELDHYAAMGSTASAQAVLDYQKTPNSVLEAALPAIDPAGLTRGTAAAS